MATNASEDQSANEKLTTFSIKTTYFAITVPLLVYFFWFGLYLNRGIAKSPEAWAHLGDFLTGISTPVITLFALLWLIQSVQLQRTEMAKTSAALQNSERSQAELVKQGRVNLQIAATTALIQVQTNAYQAAFDELQEVKKKEERITAHLAGASMPMISTFVADVYDEKQLVVARIDRIKQDIDRYHAELVGLLKSQTDAVVSLPPDDSAPPASHPTTAQSPDPHPPGSH